MAKLEIQTGKNNPILRQVSEPVKNFDKNLKKFVKDLKETMLKANGLGIAAPQVGKHWRLFITTLDYDEPGQRFITMINPIITPIGNEKKTGEEGCLSLPGIFGKVERHNRARVEYLDVDGNRQVLELRGLNARVIQHENDHLDGMLFVDRMKKDVKEEDLLM